MNQKMTKKLLFEKVDYNAETGVFTWKRNGDVAGYPKSNGYMQVRIDGKYYLLHRLAWLYVYGEFPLMDLDHINRVRSDNRLSNLRLATKSTNQQNRSLQINNQSGVSGVVFNKQCKTWNARIKANKKLIHLGSFKSFDDAVIARKKAEELLWSKT